MRTRFLPLLFLFLFSVSPGVLRAEEFPYDGIAEKARRGSVEAYVEMGDFFLKTGLMEPDREIAARWYGEAARHGSAAARERLAKLKLPVPMLTNTALPPCGEEKLGRGELTGVYMEDSNHMDAYGWIIRTGDGVVDVIMGNGEYEEFMDIRPGDTVFMRYEREQALDSQQALCVRLFFYEQGSGKIVRRGGK